MTKVFLSHSSKDKEKFVRQVAEKLIADVGFDNVVYDEFTFEKGKISLEEINVNLEKTDLFVIFLSNEALESEWVQYELENAEKLKDMGVINRILPIIIDGKISYSDARIPEYLRKNYNIKPIMRPMKAYKLIKQRLLEINWKNYPGLKEESEIFVGRNQYIQDFETRYYSWDKDKINIVIAYGLKNIGRKTLTKKCLKTVDAIKSYAYDMSTITMNSMESLEDFILKIYDLGFSEEMDLNNLLATTIEVKVGIALKLIKDIQKNNEIIHLEDEGGIVAHDGKIVSWFLDISKGMEIKDRVTFAVTSKFRVATNELWKYENIYKMEVKEFTRTEVVGLFTRYLGVKEINLEREKFKTIVELLKGYPDQVRYSVFLIKEEGINWVLKNLDKIVEYNDQKVLKILEEIEDETLRDLLVLMCNFEYIGYEFIFQVVEEEENYKKYLSKLINRSICEYVGTNKEYVKVNESIRDHVLRNNMKLNEKYKKRIEKLVEEKINSLEDESFDIPEVLFSIKQTLKSGKNIESKFLIPSHYLTLMNELYNKDKNYQEVIVFADKILESEKFIEERMIFEIRYLLCLSLAKLRDRRFLDEVHKINGADHEFLMAYYYRLINKYDKALERLLKSLAIRKKFAKANRELVQVYMNLQEYDKAKIQAKKNFEHDKSNPYHIQAYFNCLIRSEKSDINRGILCELLDLMAKVNSDIAKEMIIRLKAQFEAFYNDNEEEAIMLINKAIEEYPKLMYAMFIKFEICDKFDRIDDMNNIITALKARKNGGYKENIVYYEAIYLAKKGSVEEAIYYAETNLKNYTDEARERVKLKLKKYRK